MLYGQPFFPRNRRNVGLYRGRGRFHRVDTGDMLKHVSGPGHTICGRMMGGSEQDLLARLREGDREAQRELYEATVEQVYGVLLRMTRSEDVAFELAQETYLRAFTHFDGFTGGSALATWLYRIAVNGALQHIRRRDRERRRLQTLGRQDWRSRDEPSADLKLDVQAALAILDPMDQTVLVLRYQEGLDYRTIGQVLDCEAGTVASRLNRARAKLREKLADSYATREETRADHHQRN